MQVHGAGAAGAGARVVGGHPRVRLDGPLPGRVRVDRGPGTPVQLPPCLHGDWHDLPVR